MLTNRFKFIFLFFLLAPVIGFAQNKTTVLLDGPQPLSESLSGQVSTLITSFNKAFYKNTPLKLTTKMMSEQAIKSIRELWAYRPFYSAETNLTRPLIQRSDSLFEIRGIPVTIPINKDSLLSEQLVLVYDRSGLLTDVHFGLEVHQYESILAGGLSVTDVRRRQIILDFVESFRTAYNRKDLNFLESVFSDQALIIVGHVIQHQEDNSAYLEANLGKERVQLIRQSKAEYLEGLGRVFKANEYIKVGFNDIEVVRHRKYQTIYGVSLLQYWYSSRYSDKGYLFLMIDFRNESEPMIHVRAWQPEKHTDPDSVISLGDFEIIE